jgi:hypothetical protein
MLPCTVTTAYPYHHVVSRCESFRIGIDPTIDHTTSVWAGKRETSHAHLRFHCSPGAQLVEARGCTAAALSLPPSSRAWAGATNRGPLMTLGCPGRDRCRAGLIYCFNRYNRSRILDGRPSRGTPLYNFRISSPTHVLKARATRSSTSSALIDHSENALRPCEVAFCIAQPVK